MVALPMVDMWSAAVVQRGDVSTRSTTLLRNKARGHWLQPDSLSTGPPGRDTPLAAAAARPAVSPLVRRPQRSGQAAVPEPQQLRRPQASSTPPAPPRPLQASPTPAAPPAPIAARPQRANMVRSQS